jgi:hypothetical protein
LVKQFHYELVPGRFREDVLARTLNILGNVMDRGWVCASAGEVIFYDPNRKIEKAQHHGCNVKPIDDKKWEDIARRLLYLEKIFALGIGKNNSHLTLRVDGKTESLTPDKFLWVIPTGSLEGYH